MTRRQRIYMMAAIVITGVALDHLTKFLAIRLLKDHDTIPFPASWYPHDLFRFCFATNKGAFLSLGETLPDGMRLLLLTGVNAIVLIAILVYLLMKTWRHPVLVAALSLILSGGIGNLLDRLFREGRVVVDFMNMGIKIGPLSTRTGIFNIADLAIVAGVVVMLAYELFASKQVRDPDEKAMDVPRNSKS